MSIQNIEINELNPEIIPPLTDKYTDPNYNGGSKIVVVGKPGCFALGTKILMYNGDIKEVQDVKVGDVVMGDNSTPRNVLEICNNRETMYKISPKYGESYTVNENHKLVLIDKDDNIIEIKVGEYIRKDYKWKKNWYIFRKEVHFKDIDTTTDTYTYGTKINDLDLIHKDYLCNSKEKRLSLLAGMIDSATNAYYDITNNSYNLVIKHKTLAEQIVYLCRTLGLATKLSKLHRCNDDVEYNINMFGNIDQIPSKIQSKVKPNWSNILRSKFFVYKLTEDNYYGFTLDYNHRFLLASCDVVRNTGKSTLIKGLLYAKKHIFPVGIAMSGSEDTNHAFSEIMPTTFVYNNYDEEKIKELVKRQKIARQYLPNPWAFMILDDCTDDPRIFNKPLQNALFKKGRHWSLMYILSLQYAMDVKPQIRTNIDGIFILREPIESNREKLYRNFASIIPTYDIFCDLMNQLTEDYHALYIHNATKSNNWQDCVFYWKAPLTPKDWKVGCPEYWDFHNQRYNQNYTDPIEF